ncbi:MAG: nuclear transport factor 2 family protein [Alphaproteobacteria bacterium]|nr:nuclear transport factor 2 family protein [Alphaproteobacteria bacterium]MBV9370398.1 nuclear transport factor 2 family protein [Alphaproteobacteria bacterium]MBV9900335.1 nuclear transport factor 2 family protein [Alphaproteobacteria bacterium]
MPDRPSANLYRTRSAAAALSLALGLSIAAGAARAAPPHPVRPPAAPDSLVRTVEEFTRAQQAFDPATLARLTTPDYLEISPLGEVDSREKMLGFYAPDRKTPAPRLAMSEVSVRTFGEAAVLVARIAYTMQPPAQAPDQPPRVMAMRASFVARRVPGGWKIASAHYTGIRPSSAR